MWAEVHQNVIECSPKRRYSGNCEGGVHHSNTFTMNSPPPHHSSLPSLSSHSPYFRIITDWCGLLDSSTKQGLLMNNTSIYFTASEKTTQCKCCKVQEELFMKVEVPYISDNTLEKSIRLLCIFQ